MLLVFESKDGATNMEQAGDKLGLLEERIRKLEAGDNDGKAVKRLWESVRDERDVDVLLSRLREATAHRTMPSRATTHGTIDAILDNGGNMNFTPTPIIATSSEPCVIIVVTLVTATVCDD